MPTLIQLLVFAEVPVNTTLPKGKKALVERVMFAMVLVLCHRQVTDPGIEHTPPLHSIKYVNPLKV